MTGSIYNSSEELQELSDYQYYVKNIKGKSYIYSFSGFPIGKLSFRLIEILKKSHIKQEVKI